MVSFNVYKKPEDCYCSHSKKDKFEANGRLSNLPESKKKIAEQWYKPKYI